MDSIQDLEGVAIIGMAARFPGADNCDKLWRNLCEGRETITNFTDDEIDPVVPEREKKLSNYVKARGVIDNADKFDAAFFGITPKEAEMMDPQQRVFLEIAWETFENAGYNPTSTNNLVGVFAGMANNNTYFLNHIHGRKDIVDAYGQFETFLANGADYLATRISYKLNLLGPSINVYTACSTSLVAVCMGFDALTSYQCDLALSGGVSIFCPQNVGYLYEEEKISSVDGHCRPFDAQANGTVFSNGAGAVLLKRLADAIQDGDRIYAVIKGAAMNNDGSKKMSFMAPSIDGQAKAIRMAQSIGGVQPDTISYIEAHGTGTKLGDPVEIEALTQAFRAHTEKKGFCAIGSIKSNFGHLNAAAGIAGLIKTALMLEHRKIPPTVHFKNPNPNIDFLDSPFYVNQELIEWKNDASPLRAGVSSFGVGGTNAHVVLEEAPAMMPSDASRPSELLVLSAKTKSALATASENLIQYLSEGKKEEIGDIAYTLQIGRKEFNHRQFVVCRNAPDAEEALQAMKDDIGNYHYCDGNTPEIVFMFSGQGSQYQDMTLGLYESEFEFRKQIDTCSELLIPHLGLDLREVMFPDRKASGTEEIDLSETRFTQPALFVVEYALAKLLMSWGIQPSTLVGHSIGEYVAACISGIFTLEDGLSLVATRGRLMNSCDKGAMSAVHLSGIDIQPFLNEHIALAAINSPNLCVISGGLDHITNMENVLTEKGIGCRRLKTSHAFHSKMMDPIEEEFRKKAGEIEYHNLKIPLISTVTGTWIDSDEMADPNYWVKNFRQTVRFSDCLNKLLKEKKNRILIEVGPGQTLSTFAKQHGREGMKPLVLPTTRHALENMPDHNIIFSMLGTLWAHGVEVNWQAFQTEIKRRRIKLPAYPFERARFWIEAQNKNHKVLNYRGKQSDNKTSDSMFYIPSWRRVQTSKNAGINESSSDAHWLIFCDDLGFGAGLTERLLQMQQNVTVVMAGERFSRKDGTFFLNPSESKDFQQLFNELKIAGKPPAKVIYLWSLSKKSQNQQGYGFRDTCFNSIIFLAQAIDDHFSGVPVQIKVISNHLQNVIGDEVLIPEKATLLGPCRVIPKEYPYIHCASIDIDLPDRKSDWIHTEETLIRGIKEDGDEGVIAYRGKHRWVENYEPAKLNTGTVGAARIKEGGVYLITGGLGGIGLSLAESIAEAAKVKLVLMSRSPMPPKSHWSKLIETHNDEQNTLSHKIKKLRDIEKLGSEITLLSCDVRHQEQMKTALDMIHKNLGTINGIIHAAGIPGAGIIQFKEPESAARTLSPKVDGTILLAKLLDGAKLDFFVLCSSISSIIGGVGQVDYCAGNAFLDAFANSENIPNVISINWCPWQEVGMAVNTKIPDDFKERRAGMLRSGISVEEGKEAFRHILSSSEKQVIVSKKPVSFWSEAAEYELSRKDSVNAADVLKTHHGYDRPELPTEVVLPFNSTEKTIAEIWQELIGIQKVGINDNFFDLGGHSLLVAKMIDRLRKAFPQVILSKRTIFEKPTIKMLSAWVNGEKPSENVVATSKNRGMRRRERLTKHAN